MTRRMLSEHGDSIVTTAAIGLLAYASADVAHHVLGHGAACLASGGRIRSLTSIFVDCTVRSAAVDLAGPLANLATGLIAMLATRRSVSPAMQLFCNLMAAFNLFWFALQLVYSAAMERDDWAWAMHQFGVGKALRSGLIIAGLLGYAAIVRVTAAHMTRFANPRGRASQIARTAWLTAGLFACLTAAFDSHGLSAILRSAAPQSFLLSAGILLVPSTAARLPSSQAAPPLPLSFPWLVAAVVVAAASIFLLGHGVALWV